MVNTSSPQFVAKVRKYILAQFGNSLTKFGHQIDFALAQSHTDTPETIIGMMLYDDEMIGYGRYPFDKALASWGYKGDDADDFYIFARIIKKVGVQMYKEYRRDQMNKNKKAKASKTKTVRRLI